MPFPIIAIAVVAAVAGTIATAAGVAAAVIDNDASSVAEGNKKRLTRAKSLATNITTLHIATQSTATQIKHLHENILTIVRKLMQTPDDYESLEGLFHALDITTINTALDGLDAKNGNANIGLLIGATIGSIAIATGTGGYLLKTAVKFSRSSVQNNNSGNDGIEMRVVDRDNSENAADENSLGDATENDPLLSGGETSQQADSNLSTSSNAVDDDPLLQCESEVGPRNIESGAFKFERKMNNDTFDADASNLESAGDLDATPVYAPTTQSLGEGLAEGGADAAEAVSAGVLGAVAISAVALMAVVLAVVAIADLAEDIHTSVDDDADEVKLKSEITTLCEYRLGLQRYSMELDAAHTCSQGALTILSWYQKQIPKDGTISQSQVDKLATMKTTVQNQCNSILNNATWLKAWDILHQEDIANGAYMDDDPGQQALVKGLHSLFKSKIANKLASVTSSTAWKSNLKTRCGEADARQVWSHQEDCDVYPPWLFRETKAYMPKFPAVHLGPTSPHATLTLGDRSLQVLSPLSSQ